MYGRLRGGLGGILTHSLLTAHGMRCVVWCDMIWCGDMT